MALAFVASSQYLEVKSSTPIFPFIECIKEHGVCLLLACSRVQNNIICIGLDKNIINIHFISIDPSL